MGYCKYVYNPSEIYQRSKPGQGVETSCGAETYPAIDEPEIILVTTRMEVDPSNPQLGSVPVSDWRWTGNYIAREQDDPYCPMHGGSPEPEQAPVSMAELEAAYNHYQALAEGFRGQVAIADVPEPLAITSGDHSAE